MRRELSKSVTILFFGAIVLGLLVFGFVSGAFSYAPAPTPTKEKANCPLILQQKGFTPGAIYQGDFVTRPDYDEALAACEYASSEEFGQ